MVGPGHARGVFHLSLFAKRRLCSQLAGLGCHFDKSYGAVDVSRKRAFLGSENAKNGHGSGKMVVWYINHSLCLTCCGPRLLLESIVIIRSLSQIRGVLEQTLLGGLVRLRHADRLESGRS